MELMRMRPFGQRRKTYFYAVAGLVLAAHVVVGAIFHVLPPELDDEGLIFPVEVQIIDRLLADAVVESSAVRMIEEAGEGEEELLIFPPVWDGTPAAPDLEPLGPTESVLPDVVIEEPDLEPDLEPAIEPAIEPVPDPDPVPAVDEVVPAVPPVVKVEESTPPPPAVERKPPVVAPKVTSPPTKPKPETPQRVASKPPVRSAVRRVEPKPEPKPEPVPVPEPEPRPEPVIERAIPVAPQPVERTGILNRIRGNRETPRASADEFVPARWSKRPPPYYPYEALKQGIEGLAHVRVSIDSSGRITSARLVRSTGNELLDRAAMASVRKGVLTPARRGGRAVPSEMLVPFDFTVPEP